MIQMEIRSQHDVGDMGMAGFASTLIFPNWTEALDHAHFLIHQHGEDSNWANGLVAILIWPVVNVNTADDPPQLRDGSSGVGSG